MGKPWVLLGVYLVSCPVVLCPPNTTPRWCWVPMRRIVWVTPAAQDLRFAHDNPEGKQRLWDFTIGCRRGAGRKTMLDNRSAPLRMGPDERVVGGGDLSGRI